MLIYLLFEEMRDYESALIIIKYMYKVAVVLIFTSHMDGCATLFPTLSGTSDYYEQNIVNIRIALSVIGEESICSHLRFWGFSIFSVSAKIEGSDEVFECYHFLGS